MNCPTCTDERLVMTDRSGIEIDYCPKCRGVWLDRGELDKLIERSIAASAPVPSAPVAATPAQAFPAPAGAPQGAQSPSAPPPPEYRRKRDDDWDDDDDDDWDDRKRREGYGYPPGYPKGYKKKSKTKSLLGEIFDF